MSGQWAMTLDEYDDGSGVVNFSIDLTDEQVNEPPRELLRYVTEVAMYILDHDLLDDDDD